MEIQVIGEETIFDHHKSDKGIIGKYQKAPQIYNIRKYRNYRSKVSDVSYFQIIILEFRKVSLYFSYFLICA
jgi:hypothetical protein